MCCSRATRLPSLELPLNKNTVAAVITAVSVIGAVVLFALNKNEGATLVLGVAASSATWIHGYSTYNPKLRKDN